MTYLHPAPPAWAASARPGDIVMFRFPLGEGGESEKPRPCLIVARSIKAGIPRLTLAYGTSAPTNANQGLDLRLDAPADWQPAGLRRATRFVLMRRITVGTVDHRFDHGASDDPRIGSLPDQMNPALAVLIRTLGHRITTDTIRGPVPQPTIRRPDFRRITSRRRDRTIETVIEVRRKKFR